MSHRVRSISSPQTLNLLHGEVSMYQDYLIYQIFDLSEPVPRER